MTAVLLLLLCAAPRGTGLPPGREWMAEAMRLAAGNARPADILAACASAIEAAPQNAAYH